MHCAEHLVVNAVGVERSERGTPEGVTRAPHGVSPHVSRSCGLPVSAERSGQECALRRFPSAALIEARGSAPPGHGDDGAGLEPANAPGAVDHGCCSGTERSGRQFRWSSGLAWRTHPPYRADDRPRDLQGIAMRCRWGCPGHQQISLPAVVDDGGRLDHTAWMSHAARRTPIPRLPTASQPTRHPFIRAARPGVPPLGPSAGRSCDAASA